MKAILHIIHGLTIGGVEIDLLNKCVYLVKTRGYSMTICCLMRRGELAPQFEAQGIQVIGPLMRHRYDMGAGIALRRLLTDPKYQVVHTHICAANLITWAIQTTLPKRWRRPFFASEHAMAERWPGWVQYLVRHMARDAIRFFVPSQALAKSYHAIGLPTTRVTVLPNGINIERFRHIDYTKARETWRGSLAVRDDEFVIGTVARLVPVKNLPLLFAAVADLPVRLLVVGDGPQRTKLAALVMKHGWQERIHLLGSRSDVPEFLAACDLIVLSSRSESFGLVVAEALLMERPVVATAVGGIPEITGDGVYAQLVPPDDIKALREGIEQTMARYQSARQVARQGKVFIEATFAIERCGEQLHQFYAEVF